MTRRPGYTRPIADLGYMPNEHAMVGKSVNAEALEKMNEELVAANL